MNSLDKILHAVPVLLIGGLIGFYVRELTAPSAAHVVSSQSLPVPRQESQKPVADNVAEQFDPANRFEELVGQNGKNRAASDWPDQRARAIAEFSVEEVQAALLRLKEISDIRKRSTMLSLLLQRWAQLDGRTAFEYLSAMGDGEMKAQAMTGVAKVLARSDPHYLAEKAASMPANRVRRELIQELSKGWAEQDLLSAVAWAEALPEDLSKTDALAIIRFQWAAQNPAEASAQVQQLPPGDQRNSLITAVSEQWGARDPKAAIAWAETLPEMEKKLALSNLIGAWAQTDPWESGKFAASLPEGEVQNRAAIAVVSNWANRDPEAAAGWVLQFPEGTAREQGIREVVTAWTRMNSDDARDWAEKLPSGPMRDTALKGFVESISYWAPEKAGNVGALIADPLKRREALETTLRSWDAVSPQAARQWLAQLNIPDELKTELGLLETAN